MYRANSAIRKNLIASSIDQCQVYFFIGESLQSGSKEVVLSADCCRVEASLKSTAMPAVERKIHVTRTLSFCCD